MSKIALLLLAFRMTSWPGSLYFRMARNWAIYKAFFVAFVVNISLTLVEKRVVIACCYDWCNTNVLENKKAYPPVDRRASLNLAQSKSKYETNSSITSDLNVITNSKLFANYQKIWFIKVQYIEPRFAQYQLKTLTG